MSRTQEPPRPKRKRSEADLNTEKQDEQSSPKRCKLHSAEFYDSLPRIWLTRRALKELDRRTRPTNSAQPTAPPTSSKDINRQDTWKQIKRFARHGGPELRDLRGFLAPADFERTMSASHSSGTRRTKSTAPTGASSKKRSSAYDKNFELHLSNHQIYVRNRKSKPNNLEDIQQKLLQPRSSLSPSRFSDGAFERFQDTNEDVIEEGEVMRDIVPIIAGASSIPNKQNLLFTRLDSITGSTTVDAQPDFFDGARLEDINERVRDDIGDFIVPTGHMTAPVAPNFFLEVKRPSGDAEVAKRQACHNGAIGARGMHQLQSYGQDEPVYDGSAYTMSTTYHNGSLTMYTTHPTQSVNGTAEYHMTQMRSFALTDTPNAFRQGVTAFRNGRDWAQEQRNTLISAANGRAKTLYPGPASLNDPPASTDVQDLAYPTANPDPINDHRYNMSQSPLDDEEVTYLHAEPSAFEPSDLYGPAEGPEMPPDKLALEAIPETIETVTAPSSDKRRRRSSRNTAAPKLARHNDDKRRKHRPKQ